MEGKRFHCRQWALAKLAHSLEQPSGTMIVGGAGAGKTALCRHIVQPARGDTRASALHNRLLAFHFCCAHDADTLSPAQFILSLVAQLMVNHNRNDVSPSSPGVESYAEKVTKDVAVLTALLPDSLDKDPDEGFKKAVVFPICEIEPPEQTLFLLVDSIDEMEVGCSLQAGSKTPEGPSKTIAELLCRHHRLFPYWLVLVCTARKQSKQVARMFAGFRKVALDDLRKSSVARDAQRYILARLDREQALRSHVSRDTAEMLNQLHVKAAGCFLYLETVLDGVADNFVVLREVREIPGTLNGLYLWLCQRLFNKKQFAKVQPLLNVILASSRPIDADQLFSAVSTSNTTLSREDFNKRLHLVRRVLAPGLLVPLHHSFAEWLLDVKHCTKRFLCDAAHGHAMLAMSETLRARQLTHSQVHDFALHLSRVQFPKASASGEYTVVLDNQLLLTLWLIDSGADVKSCLLSEPPPVIEQLLRDRLSLPRDQKAVSLLVEAGAIRPEQDSAMEESQISLEEAPAEEVDPLAEFRALTLNGDGSARTVLHCLAAEGNAELVQLALDRGVDIEATDRHGQTALNLAARHGHCAVVRALIAAHANTDHADTDGWTALRAAAWGGHTAVVSSLLSGGAAVDHADGDGRTALRAAAWAGHEDIVLALLTAGADPNLADAEGRTPLIAAAYMGHADIVSHLLRNRAALDHADADGRTALSVAALCVPNNAGAATVLQLLLEKGAVVDHQDKEGNTPLLVAASEGHRDACELLLEWDACVDGADSMGRSPLWTACSAGHSEVVRLLLFWGCSVDGMDNEGRTALSVAAAQGSADTVQQLLDRGLDEQHRDNAGWTPLHYAAFEGRRHACASLLDAGARHDTPDNEGRQPLHLAAQEGHTRLADSLLRRGAFVDARAHDGKTPLRLACMEAHAETVRLLLLANAGLDLVDADGRSALYVLALDNRLEMAQVLLEEGADPMTRDSEGRTALHVSAWQGHTAMVALLLAHGAQPGAEDAESRTPLQSAAWQGHCAVVSLLLEAGAPPDHACSQGATALGIAAQEGHEGCVRALLKHGADANHADRRGRNARRIAAKSGHENVLRLLEACAGGSTSASASTTETKPSSAVLVNYSPVESPDSPKRRSLLSLGNHSSNSSNLTNSTKSSLEPPAPAVQGGQRNGLSFTQQLQQCSQHRGSISKLLLGEDTSPIYTSPAGSPDEMPTLDRDRDKVQSLEANICIGSSNMASTVLNKQSLLASDPHFARDTHMRIILGNSGVSRSVDSYSLGKAKRNGIATNPALRIVRDMRNNMKQTQPTQGYRKETPL